MTSLAVRLQAETTEEAEAALCALRAIEQAARQLELAARQVVAHADTECAGNGTLLIGAQRRLTDANQAVEEYARRHLAVRAIDRDAEARTLAGTQGARRGLRSV